MTLPPEMPIQRYVTIGHSDDLAAYWRDALGWIACYFAQLEGLSYQIIDKLGSPRDKTVAADMPYQRRTELAKRLICSHLSGRGDLQLADEWAAFLTEVRMAAPLRNDILHNPLSVNILSVSPITNPDESIVLVRKPGRPKIGLGAVQHFAQSVRELNQRMLDLVKRSSPWQP